ncbi:unnamed protein product [Lampetra planeri]
MVREVAMTPACSIAALLAVCVLGGGAVAARTDRYGASPDSNRARRANSPSEEVVTGRLRASPLRLFDAVCRRAAETPRLLRALHEVHDLDGALTDGEALPRSADKDVTEFNYNPFGLRFGRRSGAQSLTAAAATRSRAESACAPGKHGCRLVISKYKLRL